MSWQWVALTLALIATAAAAAYAGRIWWHRHLHLVAHEKAKGWRRLRNRHAHLAGRERSTYSSVERAETMYGWVWFSTTRKRNQPLTQAMGWAPSEAIARRRLARHLGVPAVTLKRKKRRRRRRRPGRVLAFLLALARTRR